MGRIIVLIIPSVVAFYIVHDLANAVLQLNRSKTMYNKIMFRKSIKERLLLKGYYADAKKRKCIIKYCIILNITYFAVFFAIAIFIIIYLLTPKCYSYFLILLFVKTIVLDMQVFIYALLHSKHLKNGGVTWRI